MVSLLQGAAVLAGVCAMACGETPTIRGCEIGGNTAAKNSGIAVVVAEPYRCDFTVSSAGQPVALLVGFFAPSAWYHQRETIHVIAAWHTSGFQQLGEPVVVSWGIGPECDPYLACIGLSGDWSAATGDAQGGRYTDQYRAAGATLSGDGLFLINFTGIIGRFADIIGPVSITGGSTSHWSADVVGDTLSYRYQWLVDGAPIYGATSRSFSTDFGWVESGNHAIIGIARLMDETTDTVTKSVSVSMGAAWTGPTELGPYEQGTWQAVAYSGRYPITCQWRVDYTVQPETSCSLSRSFDPVTTHYIGVSVTDSRDVTADSGDWSVHVNCGPGCNDYYRVPPKTPTTKRNGQ
jgi:hypothetical protein